MSQEVTVLNVVHRCPISWFKNQDYFWPPAGFFSPSFEAKERNKNLRHAFDISKTEVKGGAEEGGEATHPKTSLKKERTTAFPRKIAKDVAEEKKSDFLAGRERVGWGGAPLWTLQIVKLTPKNRSLFHFAA